jgi:hypothetical protein
MVLSLAVAYFTCQLETVKRHATNLLFSEVPPTLPKTILLRFNGNSRKKTSQLVYSASNLNVPQETIPIIKTKLFRFLWKNKKDKIKREGLYQDRDKGGIRMIDVRHLTI